MEVFFGVPWAAWGEPRQETEEVAMDVSRPLGLTWASNLLVQVGEGLEVWKIVGMDG